MIEGKNVKNGNVKCMRKKDFSEDEERKKKSDVKKYKITINSREMQSGIFECQKKLLYFIFKASNDQIQKFNWGRI